MLAGGGLLKEMGAREAPGPRRPVGLGLALGCSGHRRNNNSVRH